MNILLDNITKRITRAL